jgi:hypothetical protein
MRIIGLHLLKKLGTTLVIVILGAALLQKIFAEVRIANAEIFVGLLLLSPIAYALREASRKKPLRTSVRRTRERTRFAAGRPEEG